MTSPNNNNYDTIIQDIISSYKYIYKIQSLVGFNRYSVSKNRIEEKRKHLNIYTCAILLLGVCISCYMTYRYGYVEQKLLIPEIFGLLSLLPSFLLIITDSILMDDNCMFKLVQNFIRLDIILNSEIIKYLRNMERYFMNTYVVLWFLTIFIGTCVIIVDVQFQTKTWDIIYFSVIAILCFATICDQVSVNSIFLYILFRVHYLNVALMKIGNIDKEHVGEYPFLKFAWKYSRVNDIGLPEFSKSDFMQAFYVIFEIISLSQKCFRSLVSMYYLFLKSTEL